LSAESATPDGGGLISGSTLKRSMVWNALGCGVSIGVAVAGLPLLIDGYGYDRFGFIILIWVLVGNIAIVDLGLGYALTKFVAERVPSDKTGNTLHSLIGTALTTMLGIGIVVGALLGLSSTPIVTRLVRVPPALEIEAIGALKILSVAVPLILLNVGFRGLLEAYQEFAWVNLLRVLTNATIVVGPLTLTMFQPRLEWVALLLVVLYATTLLLQTAICWKVVPDLHRGLLWSRAELRRLLGFGGWMALSNIVGIPLLFMDRLLIAGMVSVTALTFYATPAEIAMRLWLVPLAISGVMFPTFAMMFARDKRLAVRLFERVTWRVGITALVVVFLLHTTAEYGFRLWLGAELAIRCVGVMRIMLIGVFVGSMSMLTACLLQSIGRPARVAVMHLLEFPFYLAGLVLLTERFGIEGAAWTWTIRLCVEAFVLLRLLQSEVGEYGLMFCSNAAWMSLGIILLSVVTLIDSLVVRLWVLVATIAAALSLVWRHRRNREGRLNA
jgi:O-antigen/teichoic acid export membrane protein